MQQEKENPQKDPQKSFLAASLTAAHTQNALSWKEPSPISAQVWQRTKRKARPSIFTDSAGTLPSSQVLCSSLITSQDQQSFPTAQHPNSPPPAPFSPSFLTQLRFPLSTVWKTPRKQYFGGIWAPVMDKPLQSCSCTANTNEGARHSATGCLNSSGRWSSHGTLGLQGRVAAVPGEWQ